MRNRIKKQIADSYGRVLYSYYTQENQASIYEGIHACLRWIKIAAAAVSNLALIALNVISEENKVIGLWTSAIASLVVVALEKVMNELALDKKCAANHSTGNALWGLRESYESLMIDSTDESKDLADIKLRRDELQNQVQKIYATAPRTGSRAYKKAECFIKNKGHVFSNKELNDTILSIDA